MYRSDRAQAADDFSGPQTVPELTGIGQVGDPWLDASERYMMFTLGGKPRDLYEARR